MKLKISRAEAKDKLDEQADKGRTLCNQLVQNSFTSLDEFKSALKKWRETTTVVLSYIFEDSDKISKFKSRGIGLFQLRRWTKTQTLQHFQNELSDQIHYLQSCVEVLGLHSEPTPNQVEQNVKTSTNTDIIEKLFPLKHGTLWAAISVFIALVAFIGMCYFELRSNSKAPSTTPTNSPTQNFTASPPQTSPSTLAPSHIVTARHNHNAKSKKKTEDHVESKMVVSQTTAGSNSPIVNGNIINNIGEQNSKKLPNGQILIGNMITGAETETIKEFNQYKEDKRNKSFNSALAHIKNAITLQEQSLVVPNNIGYSVNMYKLYLEGATFANEQGENELALTWINKVPKPQGADVHFLKSKIFSAYGRNDDSKRENELAEKIEKNIANFRNSIMKINQRRSPKPTPTSAE